MRKAKAIVLRTAGTNCDYETAFAFQLVGAEVELVHVNELIRREKDLSPYQILALPGGFTYGDDIAAGKILANELKFKLQEPLEKFIAEGKLIIGICNGFQVLVKAGFLPALEMRDREQEVTLIHNDSGKFEDRWVYLQNVSGESCLFTKGMEEIIYLPVAHAEGKFMPRDRSILDKLKANGQIIFQYVDREGNLAGYPWNPNGSIENIAGICDPTGRILGMMPHPERYLWYTNHPRWTRENLRKEGEGLKIFANALQYVKANL